MRRNSTVSIADPPSTSTRETTWPQASPRASAGAPGNASRPAPRSAGTLRREATRARLVAWSRAAAGPPLLAAALVTLAGCSITDYAVRAVGDGLADASGVYARDGDIELVAAATPFGLKTMEALLARSPDHPGLLLSLARGFTPYAYAFVEQEAELLEETDLAAALEQRERARRLYLRARDYGLRGLDVAHPGMARRITSGEVAVLEAAGGGDVGLLYWTGVAWAAAIALSKDDPFLLADLPLVEALVLRALALEEDFDAGAIHVFLVGFEMSRAGLSAGAEERASAHYRRALELSGGHQAAPFVAYGEAVAVARGDREEFRAVLERALAVDVDARPERRLANVVMQRRARWLIGRSEHLFAD
jgi:predicted anti-sigma-YlaC factor YlaD